MNTQAKRIRMTKGRDRRWMTFMGTIAATWARAVREQRPENEVFKELSDAISKLDVTPMQRADLSTRNWGARDLVVALHAEWVLYLDGKRRTFDEISAIANAEEKAVEHLGIGAMNDARISVHNRTCGRFEWRGTGKPFYDRSEPALLATPSLPQPSDTDAV